MTFHMKLVNENHEVLATCRFIPGEPKQSELFYTKKFICQKDIITVLYLDWSLFG